MDDWELAALLRTVPPRGRDVLRRLMRADQFERDEAARALLHELRESARLVADLIDLATLHPDVRQRLARLLGQLQAEDDW